MNTTGIIVVVVLIAGGYYFVSSRDGAMTKEVPTETAALSVDVTDRENVMGKEDEKMEDTMLDKDNDDVMEKEEDEAMMEKEDVMEKHSSAKPTQQATIITAVSSAPGSYSVYSENKRANADGNVVLFFKAAWCPTCRTLDKDIKSHLENIPSDLTILELDYDSETILKQQYGVTQQHTLIQVDTKGNLIKTWSGGSTLESIVSKI